MKDSMQFSMEDQATRMEEMGELLAHCQLGYEVRRGAEAAVHVARPYISNLGPNDTILKLDFKNAFNFLLEVVQTFIPDLPSSILLIPPTLSCLEG